ncbi:MAG: SDR family NAD(P)-dependent oxidoreductase [Nanoarchaeota archaeon]|nr:SDR family NAD(P)-dependent oxidoreductase [Nanoarchaeota archaeon]
MKRKILVTGGAGFIGSHVVDELIKRGNEVVILDNFFGKKNKLDGVNKQAEIIDGDVTKREDCQHAVKDVDAIYHIAAHAAEGQSVYIPIFNAKINIMGSVTILTEAINRGIRDFVFTSSIAAYGKPNTLPITEDHPLNPEDPYGVTKKTIEDYLRVYHELDRIDPYIVRFFNVFGPRQRMNDPYRGVIPIFINRCLKGEKPVIFGDGEQGRAFTYISDIVEPMCDMVGKRELINNPINIGNTDVWTVNKLAKEIMNIMDMPGEPEHVPARPTDVVLCYSDITKAKKLLGYRPRVSIPEGLKLTLAWAKEQGPQEFDYMTYFEIPKLSHNVYKEKTI